MVVTCKWRTVTERQNDNTIMDKNQPKKKYDTPRPKIDNRPYKWAVLQREIGSQCPFCPNIEVGNFQIHHLDGNRENNVIENLLLLCGNCHTNFNKGIWQLEKGIEKKKELILEIGYNFLNSPDEFTYDYVCYNPNPSDGRHPANEPNGAYANIHVIDLHRIRIKHKEKDGRQWEGITHIKEKHFGEMRVQYVNEVSSETDKKDVYIKVNHREDLIEDIILLSPVSNFKDYDKEFLIRITDK